MDLLLSLVFKVRVAVLFFLLKTKELLRCPQICIIKTKICRLYFVLSAENSELEHRLMVLLKNRQIWSLLSASFIKISLQITSVETLVIQYFFNRILNQSFGWILNTWPDFREKQNWETIPPTIGETMDPLLYLFAKVRVTPLFFRSWDKGTFAIAR